MPNKVIKSFAERSGKSVEEVEEIWNTIKKSASSKFKEEDAQFWAYVNRKVQFKLGLAAKKTSFKEFSKEKESSKKEK